MHPTNSFRLELIRVGVYLVARCWHSPAFWQHDVWFATHLGDSVKIPLTTILDSNNLVNMSFSSGAWTPRYGTETLVGVFALIPS